MNKSGYTNTRLGMKKEHERSVLDILLQISSTSHIVLGLKEISRYTNISKSSLQRILPRLEKQGWIEKNKSRKIIGFVPSNRIDNGKLAVYTDKDGDKICVVLSNKSEQNYKEELLKIIKKQIEIDNKGEIRIKKQTYQDYLQTFDKRKQIGIRHNDNLRFPGRTKLLRKYLKREIPKQITYYKIMKYPYLQIKNKKLKIDLKSNFNIPNGKKRFWKKAAKEIKQIYDYQMAVNKNFG